ncbi:MAG: DNA-binding protein [Candidatus Aenigmatarchaeota archaeon]
MNEINQEERPKADILKKSILRKILEKNAIERLGRLRLVKPELANQLEIYLIQLYQEGKLRNIVTDDQLKAILNTLASKKNFKINR